MRYKARASTCFGGRGGIVLAALVAMAAATSVMMPRLARYWK